MKTITERIRTILNPYNGVMEDLELDYKTDGYTIYRAFVFFEREKSTIPYVLNSIRKNLAKRIKFCDVILVTKYQWYEIRVRFHSQKK